MIRKLVTAGVAAALLAFSGAPAPAQQPAASQTLAAVKKRGQLVCGVNGELPGFSLKDASGAWSGFDVDFCRAVAAATLGSASKVKFVPLTALKRFEALKAGEVDVLVRNTTVTLQRTAGTGVQFAAVTYIDGQGFVVPKKANVTALAQLANATICYTAGTTHEQNLVSWFEQRRLRVTPMPFDTLDAMYEAFYAGKCSAVTQDATGLASSIVAGGKAADYFMLPDIISREPLGPFLRTGDDQWLEIVRWTHNAMLEAEQYGVTQGNVDEQRKSMDLAVQRLLGTIPGNGKALGLDESWAYNIIKQVGSYAESYDRHFGAGSPLRFARGINALWDKGGLMYPLPMR
jgi:general L-amino acid transport system substrate-binding protein